MSFSAEGTLLASTGDDQAADVWEMESGKSILTVAADSRFYSVALSADGATLVTSTAGAAVIFWDIGTGERSHAL